MPAVKGQNCAYIPRHLVSNIRFMSAPMEKDSNWGWLSPAERVRCEGLTCYSEGQNRRGLLSEVRQKGTQDDAVLVGD